jgi:hypothetical protein
MSRRRLGPAGARALAARPSLEAAVDDLLASPYGHDVRAGDDLRQAQHAVGATLLWNGRVLAGWLPRQGVRALRLLAGWFEVLDIEARQRSVSGDPGVALLHRLGSLGIIDSRLPAASSPSEIRELLTGSPWGDPGGTTARELHLWLRLRLAARLRGEAAAVDGWASGAAALLVAREHFVRGEPLPPRAHGVASALLGPGACEARALPDFASALPSEAAWALAGVDQPPSLWQAESRWWRRVEADSRALLRQPRPGLDPVLGAVGLLAVDAWRVRAALEISAQGGGPIEVFDVVA